MLAQPYLASALARLPFIDATDHAWCPTLATDGYHIFYNASFCADLGEAELAFVIAHELFHCVLGHLDRRGDRDPERWNVAIDYATNGLLTAAGLVMPKMGLYSQTYSGMTAEEIFDCLPASLVSTRSSGPGGCGFDLHVAPGDDRLATIASVTADMPSPEERRRLRRQLGAELLRKLHGTAAGRAYAEVQRASAPPVNWRALLAQFISGLRLTDFRLFPYNRKHLWRGLYLPSLGSPGPQHLVVGVDTSGSIRMSDLAQFARQLDSLRAVSQCSVTVLQFDTAVQHVEVFEAHQRSLLGRPQRFVGRGGTDLTIPFTWFEEGVRSGRLSPRPDALIVLTDGFGPMPPRAPDYPVLWVATEASLDPFPFGATVRMENARRAR